MSVRSAEPAAVSMRYPRWFVTLFLTDIWERFSFYGMAAVLTLYAAAPVEDGGLGLDKPIAAALFGSYLGLVFLLALPGGWLGDRVFGVRRATAYGCGLIVLGHYCMAIPVRWTSYLGLLLVAAGTGLLKPNMAALLSDGYGPDERTQREAAFSIFYVSIQVSALAAPLIVGALSENLGWHWGFAAAGVGMTFGVIQFLAGGKHFGDRGLAPRQPASPGEVRRFVRRAVGAVLAFAALIAVDVIAGTFAERHLIIAVGLCAVVVPFAYFVTMMRNPLLDPPQRRRLRPFFWLLLSFSLFWLLAGQTGSMLNLFARQHTDRSMFGITLPASWFQSAVPLFILLVAPFFAWLWVRMADRISTPAKFAVSLLLAGAAFLVMSAASATALDATVSPLWLVGVFFLLACGEVIIGPVGISTATGVTSAAYAGRTVGLLWLFSGFGAGLASQVVHLADVWPDHVYYLALGALVIAGGLVVMVFRRGLAREITAQ